MDFEIINIEKHHKGKVHKLIEEINREDKLNYSLTDEWLDYVVENASQGIFLAFYGEKLAGLGTAMINPVYRDQGTLNVVVSPKYRRKGLGSLIYDRIHGYAKVRDVKIVEAYVKKRLVHGVGFAEKRAFITTMYSWEMELDLDRLDFNVGKLVDLNLRKATKKDGANYKKIIYDAFGDEVGEDALIQELRDSSIEIYFLEKEGQAIGSATIQLKKDLSLAYIYDIAILSDSRGRGLGSHLLRSCLKTLKEAGIERASLSVTGENKGALRLYRKIGFREKDIDLIMTKEIRG